MSTRRLHLNVNITDLGKDPAAWRKAENPTAFLDGDYFTTIGKVAEAATFDAVFLGDFPTLVEEVPTKPWYALDPFTVLTAIAGATSHIGLIGTGSTTFNHPFDLARRLSSIDHLSRGRLGWNIVTTMTPSSAAAFGADELPSADVRYERADEFVDLVRQLWRSWAPGALVADRGAGLLVDPDGLRPVRHRGRHFSLDGLLPLPSYSHAGPVLVQAGSSEAGVDLAARHAEVVFTVQSTIDTALAFRRRLAARAQHFGRDPDSLVVLPGLYPIVGSTEREATALLAELNEAKDLDLERAKIAGILDVDPNDLVLDEPIDSGLLATRVGAPASAGFAASLLALAKQPGMTVRKLILSNSSAHRIVVGTPDRIADDMEHWLRSGAADGFNVNFSNFTDGLQVFADHVIPELRQRGIFRYEYESSTLRGNLEL